MLDKNMAFAGSTLQDSKLALGRQITIEYHDCGSEVFLSKEKVETAMVTAAKESGATVISANFHNFEPQGVSGVVIIAESHFTIHAWPEHNYAAVDIFTCSDTIDMDIAVESMRNAFQSKNTFVSSDQNRGIVSRPVEHKIFTGKGDSPEILPLSWQKEFIQRSPWGIATGVDIYHCEPSLIRDADHIKEFVVQLCDLIKMKRFGECQVVHFGEDEKVAGYSMTQLIETSLISGHFANQSNAAYIDIFSCKYYEPREAAEFATSFFQGQHYKMQVSLRQ